MNVDDGFKTGDSGGERVWSPLELAEVKTGPRLGQIRRAKGLSGRKRMRVTDRAECFHVMSRIVNGEFLLGGIEKEAFRRMMWRMGRFAGIEILTYAIMDNHFHILLKVPEQAKWLKRFEGDGGEEHFFEHLSLVYSKAFIAQLRGEVLELRARDEEAAVQELLARFKRRFCDLSLFVKELKERFSRWYNKQNGRRGTLWMDRFKSVMVESGQALQAMAGYIDLNPVRAGIVDDPAMYEWSGYGEATGGSKRAQRGLCKVLGVAQDCWNGRAHPYYRKWLYAEGYAPEAEPQEGQVTSRRGVTGSRAGTTKRRGFSKEQVEKVMDHEVASPILPILPILLIRKRMRSFSHGIAIGSEDYVKGVAARYRDRFDRQKARKAKQLKGDALSRGQATSIYLMRE